MVSVRVRVCVCVCVCVSVCLSVCVCTHIIWFCIQQLLCCQQGKAKTLRACAFRPFLGAVFRDIAPGQREREEEEEEDLFTINR